LTVEFYRLKGSDCTHDDQGRPLAHAASKFPFGNATCGLICDPDHGPNSPMRGGSANNIYVIPTPDKLTFGTAMLLAAACCVPAILSLVSMWNKILQDNWKRRFGGRTDEIEQIIAGTNGATVGRMEGVNARVRLLLSVVEVPLFGGAVLAILGIGELNFFSRQVAYQVRRPSFFVTTSLELGICLQKHSVYDQYSLTLLFRQNRSLLSVGNTYVSRIYTY
jgi:hypothetical protein